MGAAEARLFAKEGAQVGIADILEEQGRQLEAEIAETGGEALFIRLDVTSEANWDEVVSTLVGRFGRLDVLVNNAGIYQHGTVEETTVEGWDQVMDVNARGVFLGTKAALPAMRAAGGGSIVNISSVAGLQGGARLHSLHRIQRGRPPAHQGHGGPVRQRWHPGQLRSPGTSRHRHAGRGLPGR